MRPKYEIQRSRETFAQAEASQGRARKWARITIWRRMEPEDWARLRGEALHLLARGYRCWELDLTPLEFCDSLAMGMVLTLHASIRRRGGRLDLRLDGDTGILPTLAAAGVDQIVPIIAI